MVVAFFCLTCGDFLGGLPLLALLLRSFMTFSYNLMGKPTSGDQWKRATRRVRYHVHVSTRWFFFVERSKNAKCWTSSNLGETMPMPSKTPLVSYRCRRHHRFTTPVDEGRIVTKMGNKYRGKFGSCEEPHLHKCVIGLFQMYDAGND